MKLMLRSCLMILAVAVLVPVLAQPASADTVTADFNCGGVNLCSGGPVSGGSSFATVNSVTNLLTGSIASLASDPFSLEFDTSAGTASLFDGGANVFLGSIALGSTTNQSFVSNGLTYNNLSFLAIWNLAGASADVQSFFGGQTGTGFSTVHFVSNAYGVQSADITISASVPEPGTIVLLGVGLLFCCTLVRRNKQGAELAA